VQWLKNRLFEEDLERFFKQKTEMIRELSESLELKQIKNPPIEFLLCNGLATLAILNNAKNGSVLGFKIGEKSPILKDFKGIPKIINKNNNEDIEIILPSYGVIFYSRRNIIYRITILIGSPKSGECI